MCYKCARGAVPPLGQSWHGPAFRTDASRQSCLRSAVQLPDICLPCHRAPIRPSAIHVHVFITIHRHSFSRPLSPHRSVSVRKRLSSLIYLPSNSANRLGGNELIRDALVVVTRNFFAISIISLYFSSHANILSVTYTFFPISCAYFIVSSKSLSCISALVLSDNDDVPQYTASAPYKNAIFAFSNDPAGANNSTFFILLPLLFFIYYFVRCRFVHLYCTSCGAYPVRRLQA